MWIEELKQELTGRRLDIWRGRDDAGKPIDMSPEMQEHYRQLWREQFRDPSLPLPKLEECPHHGTDLRDGQGRAVTRECASG